METRRNSVPIHLSLLRAQPLPPGTGQRSRSGRPQSATAEINPQLEVLRAPTCCAAAAVRCEAGFRAHSCSAHAQRSCGSSPGQQQTQCSYGTPESGLQVAAHEHYAQHSFQSGVMTHQRHRCANFIPSLPHLIAAQHRPTAVATSAIAGGPPAADRNPGQFPRHIRRPGLAVLKEACEARGAACRVVQDAEGECSGLSPVVLEGWNPSWEKRGAAPCIHQLPLLCCPALPSN